MSNIYEAILHPVGHFKICYSLNENVYNLLIQISISIKTFNGKYKDIIKCLFVYYTKQGKKKKKKK